MLYVLDTLGRILFTSKLFKNTLKTEPTLSRAEQCSRFVVLVAVTVSEYCTENERSFLLYTLPVKLTV